MLKKEARLLYRQKREGLAAMERIKLDDLILIQFQKINLPYLSLVLSFYPIDEKNEINTFIITDFLQFQNPGLQVAYPKTSSLKNTMEAVVCDNDAEFESNEYNIPEPVNGEAAEPSDIDMVLVPLLAFDKNGFRVGYGKGYYDRFLRDCRNDCIKIGLSYFEPVDVVDDANDFDVPLDLCITPQKAYVF